MAFKIDCHTHIGRYRDFQWSNEFAPWGKVTLKNLIKFLDNLGVNKAILLATSSWNMKNLLPTEIVLESCRKYQDRLIPFCTAEVREIYLEEKLTRYNNLGCLGVGEHTSRIRIDHRLNLRLYQVCGRLELPILIHSAISKSDPYGTLDTFNLDGLERVLKTYSNVDFIMHGPGWWRSVSAAIDDLNVTYPTGKIEQPGRTVLLLENYDNLYGDLSAHSGYNALARDLQFAQDFLKRFNNKLLYGTDLIYFFDPQILLMKLLYEIKLPPEAYENIYHKNIEKIIHM